MKIKDATSETLMQVETMYIQGKKRYDICKATGLSSGAVQFIVYKKLELHLKFGRQKKQLPKFDEVPKDKINRIITLAYWGYHVSEIAEDQGIHHNQVHGIIENAKKRGILNPSK